MYMQVPKAVRCKVEFMPAVELEEAIEKTYSEMAKILLKEGYARSRCEEWNGEKARRIGLAIWSTNKEDYIIMSRLFKCKGDISEAETQLAEILKDLYEAEFLDRREKSVAGRCMQCEMQLITRIWEET